MLNRLTQLRTWACGEFLNNFQEETFPVGWEYNLVRFLEREGYDVTYCTDVDIKQNANLPLQHRVLLVGGHSEYWTPEMRANVINARDHGVNLAIFGANACNVRSTKQARSPGHWIER